MDGIADIQGYAALANQGRAASQAQSLEGLEGGSVAQAREAAKAFEAYFVESMLKEMRRTVPMSEEGAGQAMEIFQGMFDGAISEQVADGPGIGLAAMIERSLLRSLPDGGLEEMGGLGAQHLDMERVSSAFGMRRDPLSGEMKHHDGIDIALAEGTPVRPVRSGTVVFSGVNGGYGNVVVVDHGAGVRSTYAHLEDREVHVGDRVGMDAVIGHVGSTGRSTGPHLHLEVTRKGKLVDPAEFLER